MKKNLYLIEFYTTNPADRNEGGWEINFAWVRATHKASAIQKLSEAQGNRFDCAIQTTQHAEITPLRGNFRVNTKDANLFILH